MVVLHLAGAFLRRPGLGVASAAAVLATLATLLGVAALVAVMAAMEGFRADLSKKMLGATPHLAVEAPGGPEAAVALAAILAETPGVRSARPGAAVEGLLRGPAAAVGARLVGDPEIADDEIALPLPLARRLAAPPGEEVRLLVARLSPGGALGAEDVSLSVLQIDDVPGARAPMARIGLGLAAEISGYGRAGAEAVLVDPFGDRAAAAALAGRLPEGASVRTWPIAGGGPAAIGAAGGALIGPLVAHHPEAVSAVLRTLAGDGGMTAPLHFRPSVGAAVGAALLGLAAALPSALLSAWRAASLDPVAAFRR